jgi:hypothetical protein
MNIYWLSIQNAYPLKRSKKFIKTFLITLKEKFYLLFVGGKTCPPQFKISFLNREKELEISKKCWKPFFLFAGQCRPRLACCLCRPRLANYLARRLACAPPVVLASSSSPSEVSLSPPPCPDCPPTRRELHWTGTAHLEGVLDFYFHFFKTKNSLCTILLRNRAGFVFIDWKLLAGKQNEYHTIL